MEFIQIVATASSSVKGFCFAPLLKNPRVAERIGNLWLGKVCLWMNSCITLTFYDRTPTEQWYFSSEFFFHYLKTDARSWLKNKIKNAYYTAVRVHHLINFHIYKWVAKKNLWIIFTRNIPIIERNKTFHILKIFWIQNSKLRISNLNQTW